MQLPFFQTTHVSRHATPVRLPLPRELVISHLPGSFARPIHASCGSIRPAGTMHSCKSDVASCVLRATRGIVRGARAFCISRAVSRNCLRRRLKPLRINLILITPALLARNVALVMSLAVIHSRFGDINNAQRVRCSLQIPSTPS